MDMRRLSIPYSALFMLDTHERSISPIFNVCKLKILIVSVETQHESIGAKYQYKILNEIPTVTIRSIGMIVCVESHRENNVLVAI